jgi:hypothetical protein
MEEFNMAGVILRILTVAALTLGVSPILDAAFHIEALAYHCTAPKNCPKLPPPAPTDAMMKAGRYYVCVWKDGSYPTCHAAGSKWPTRITKVEVENCRKAVEYIAGDELGNDLFAEINAKTSYKFKSRPTAEGDAYVASTKIEWKIDRENSQISWPNITWPNMTDKEKLAMYKVGEAMRRHEEGHFKVAEAIFKKHGKRLESNAATEDEALNDLKSKIDEATQEAQTELEAEAGDGGRYDAATDHGRKQSKGPKKGYPGGKNIHLACPK